MSLVKFFKAAWIKIWTNELHSYSLSAGKFKHVASELKSI